MENRKKCHHIVWVLLNLMGVGEENQLTARVETGYAALMQYKFFIIFQLVIMKTKVTIKCSCNIHCSIEMKPGI